MKEGLVQFHLCGPIVHTWLVNEPHCSCCFGGNGEEKGEGGNGKCRDLQVPTLQEGKSLEVVAAVTPPRIPGIQSICPPVDKIL